MGFALFWVAWFAGMLALWLSIARDLETSVECAVLTIPLTLYLLWAEWRDCRQVDDI
jgi:hypothetical protein